jgi:hypothetical protein
MDLVRCFVDQNVASERVTVELILWPYGQVLQIPLCPIIIEVPQVVVLGFVVNISNQSMDVTEDVGMVARIVRHLPIDTRVIDQACCWLELAHIFKARSLKNT